MMGPKQQRNLYVLFFFVVFLAAFWFWVFLLGPYVYGSEISDRFRTIIQRPRIEREKRKHEKDHGILEWKIKQRKGKKKWN